MPSALIDDCIYVETAEGVVLSAVLADPWSRAYALFLDALIIIAAIVASSFLAIMLPDVQVAIGFLLLVNFFFMWGYFFICEWRFKGMTLGKKAMNLQVVGTDLLPVTASQAAWRNVLRYVDFMPAFFAVGMLSLLVSNKNQRLGDWFAGTVVIFHKPPKIKQARLQAGEHFPPPWRLSREEQRSLIAFAHYAQTHHLERAIELSEPLAALFPDCDGATRVARLMAYARYLTGIGQ